MANENNEQIFRKKSMDRLSSPEQLTDYLHVTNPSIWIVLLSVVLILAALFVWSSQAVIVSGASGKAIAKDGILTVTFEDQDTAANVSEGMIVKIGDTEAAVTSVGFDAAGNRIAVASASVPDGEYDVNVVYRQTKIIELLFN